MGKKFKGKTHQDKVDNSIKRVGTVTKIHGSMYEVTDNESGFKVLATLNGKMRMNSIRLTIGDTVDVELSEYDLTRGRIVFRHR